MKYYKSILRFVILVPLTTFFADCAVDEYTCTQDYVSVCDESRIYNNVVNLSDVPVFPNRQKIEVPPYQFLENGTVRSSKGEDVILLLDNISDCCLSLELLDEFGSNPIFKWTASNNILYAAAIFKNKVELRTDGSSIKNVEDIVWTWNSGMSTGSQSNGKFTVSFEDGKDVKNGVIQNSLTPLDSGFAYTWMVWAWNVEGTEIVASSTSIPFRVGIPNRTPISFASIKGNWVLESATQRPVGTNVTNTFNIRRLEIWDDFDGKLKFQAFYLNYDETGLINEENDVCKLDLTNISYIKNVVDARMVCDERLWLMIETTDGLFEVSFRK